jgi:hypothetical protein
MSFMLLLTKFQRQFLSRILVYVVPIVILPSYASFVDTSDILLSEVKDVRLNSAQFCRGKKNNNNLKGKSSEI